VRVLAALFFKRHLRFAPEPSFWAAETPWSWPENASLERFFCMRQRFSFLAPQEHLVGKVTDQDHFGLVELGVHGPGPQEAHEEALKRKCLAATLHRSRSSAPRRSAFGRRPWIWWPRRTNLSPHLLWASRSRRVGHRDARPVGAPRRVSEKCKRAGSPKVEHRPGFGGASLRGEGNLGHQAARDGSMAPSTTGRSPKAPGAGSLWCRRRRTPQHR
jgi:hypothetical protein